MRLNFLVARFAGFVAPVDEAVVLALSLSVLVVPFEVEIPRLEGDADACEVCGRCTLGASVWCSRPFGTLPGLDIVCADDIVCEGGSGGSGGATSDFGRSIAPPAVEGRCLELRLSDFSDVAKGSVAGFLPSGTERSAGDIVRIGEAAMEVGTDIDIGVDGRLPNPASDALRLTRLDGLYHGEPLSSCPADKLRSAR